MSESSAPRPGDFRLVEMGGDVGRLIRVLQWLNGDGFADYEHAAVYLGDGEFVEASPHGARVATYGLFDGHVFWSSGIIPLTDTQRADIAAAARSYVGVGYGWLDYLALVAHRFGVNVPGLRGYIADSGHMICSQLVDQCYVDAGVHLFADGRWPGYVTPGDLYQLLRRRSS